MKKYFNKLIAISLLAAFALGTAMTVQAQDKAEKEKLARPVPFYGNINEIDKTAKTINIGKQKKKTIHIVTATKLTGKSWDDAAVGDEVGGSYRESADGKLEAASLRIGPKPEGEVKEKKKKTE